MNDNATFDSADHHPLARSQVYRCLAKTFGYPTKQGEGIAHVEEALPWLRQLPSEYPASAASTLLHSLRPDDLDDLQQEYVRLFDYRPVCPLQASAYLNHQTTNMLLGALVAFYADSGLACRSLMPPDHLITELELMHYLCFNEVQEFSRNGGRWRKLQSDFLTFHLYPWVPIFVAGLSSATKAPYCHLGNLLQAFIVSENELVGRRN